MKSRFVAVYVAEGPVRKDHIGRDDSTIVAPLG